MAKRKRRAFTTEFKAHAVRIVRESGKSVGVLARELDLTETALRSWVPQAEIDAGRGQDVQRKLGRLVDALADGSLPTDEIKDRLGAEKARKTALQAEMTKPGQLSEIANQDTEHLKRNLREKVSDVTALLCNHTAQARQMLRKLLTGKIELEPVGQGRERGYRFRGVLCIERLIGGEALQTSLSMVAPTGFEPVFQP